MNVENESRVKVDFVADSCRVPEKLLAADVVALAVGPAHVLALGGDGCLHAWGRGQHGRLGLGHQEDA